MPGRISYVAATLVLAAAPLMPALAFADGPADSGRYSIQPVDGGVVRLDRETGEMALCRVDKQVLSCKPADDQGKHLKAEVDQLQKRVARLEAEAKAGNVLSKALPTDKDLDQAMNVFEHLMRRVFGMVNDLNRNFRSDPGSEDGSTGSPQKT